MGLRWAIALMLVLVGGTARAEDSCSRGRWLVDLREWRAYAPSCVPPLADEEPSEPPPRPPSPGEVRWMIATPDAFVAQVVVRDAGGVLSSELRATSSDGAPLWTVRLPSGASVPVYSGGRLYVLEPDGTGIRLVEHALGSGAATRRMTLESLSAAGVDEAVLREETSGLLELTAALGRCG